MVITNTEEAVKLLTEKRGFYVEDIKKFNWRVSDEEFLENMTDEGLIDFANHQASEVEDGDI